MMEKKAKVTGPALVKKWTPPEPGWVKANADGAVSVLDKKGEGRVVLRDHDGAFQGAAVHFFPKVTSPEMAEVLAYGCAI